MLIILEGCDCTGKSTLAKQICEINNQYQVLHTGPPPGHLSLGALPLYQKKKAYEFVEFCRTHDFVVFDRGLFGEAVYGPIVRDTPYPSYLRHLERKLPEFRILLVVLWAEPKEILKRFDGKFIKPDQIKEINNAFKREFWKINLWNKHLIQQKYDGNVLKQVKRHICLPAEGG